MASSTYDLFISHSSYDRPWAERLYKDLHAAYPWIRIFWDREEIPPGAPWRTILTSANFSTKHLIVIWSDKAAASQEATLEMAHFHADVNLRPQLGGSERYEFPLVLQGNYPGAGQNLQGFPAVAARYDPIATDRGLSGVQNDPGSSEWKRLIRMVGDAIDKADQAQPMTAAIIATKSNRLPILDYGRADLQNNEGRSLDQFLQPLGLQWTNVRNWYGPSPLEWRPFGGQQTIVDLMEDLRVKANARIVIPGQRFKWEYIDPTDKAATDVVRELHTRASLVIVDPISLYDNVCANAFRGLKQYIEQEQSAVVSISPIPMPGEDLLALVLRTQTVPVLDDYFIPPIERHLKFAQCAFNVQRVDDIERLVRYRLGAFRLSRAKEAMRDTTSVTK